MFHWKCRLFLENYFCTSWSHMAALANRYEAKHSYFDNLSFMCSPQPDQNVTLYLKIVTSTPVCPEKAPFHLEPSLNQFEYWAPSTEHWVLSTQGSVFNIQFSVLSSQCSVLNTQRGNMKTETGTGRDGWGLGWTGYRNISGPPQAFAIWGNIQASWSLLCQWLDPLSVGCYSWEHVVVLRYLI